MPRAAPKGGEARMNAKQRTTEPTTARPIPAVELQLMRETWEAMPYRDGNALRLLDDYDTLAATNRALTEALRDRAITFHAFMGHDGIWEACEEEVCHQDLALVFAQPVQARDEEHGALEAMAADVRSLSTQLGQKIEQAVERDEELVRLRAMLVRVLNRVDGMWGNHDCQEQSEALCTLHIARALLAEEQRA
jgi:hypothetical protein